MGPFVCHRCHTEYPEHLPFCPRCLTDGSVGPALRRRGADVDREPELTTARALAAAHWTMLEIPACAGLRVLKNALVLLYGEPGAGKSTLGLRMLDSIAGPVVAVMAEEHLGPAVGERLSRLHIRRDDFHVLGRSSVDDLVSVVRRHHARAVLVDSLTATSLLPEDVRHLIQRLDLGALFGVLQVNKQGEMAGRKEWSHEADVVLHVDAGRWRVEKTRFQAELPSGAIHEPNEEGA
jgi:predicted ATP-dependent serine protease